MQVIPAINENDFAGVVARIQKCAEFLPPDGWVQIDAVDNIFTARSGFNSPEELGALRLGYGIELHLMVSDLDATLDSWLDALATATTGPKRAIFHLEVLTDPARVLTESRRRSIEVGLALRPETEVELAVPFLKDFPFVQILSVVPGISGQKFQPAMLDKVKFLREKSPDVIIEIDGGVNLEVAKAAKEAGANIVVAASYLFNSPSPKMAYEELTAL